ncbi:MAG TPA: glycerol-3-phosphate dehydrogenase/oxidase, partial [Actinomycetota bacterium]
MPPIGPSTRAEQIDRLAAETFDVLIVGGGVTGAGCALDAASRGLKTALVERRDFASGTSSKSSKLVHGGLRYLAQYEFGLTWEAAHERDLLARLCPHLVRPLQFLYPVFRKGKESRFAAYGLAIYDVLSAVRGVPRHRRARAPRMKELAPAIDTDRVVSAWTYWDASTDDARLVFELIRAAIGFGAAAANYVPVDGFVHDANGRLAAAGVTDSRSGRSFEIRAKTIVNATGIWAGDVGTLEDPRTPIALRPAKGIHLMIPRERIALGAACIVPSGARDRRSLFLQPWADRVMLGTTDTEYDGPLDAPAVTEADVDYVLGGINRWMDVDLTRDDLVGAWAGLRPLRAAATTERTADLSRRHAITVSPGGLISVTGGKLTTFRRMARDAVDATCERLGVKRRSDTHRIRIGLTKPIRDVRRDVAELLRAAGTDPGHAARLVETYGDLAVH